MNSILQCIFATAPLTEFFLKEYSSREAQRSSKLTQSYVDLLIKSRKGGVVTPSDLKDHVSRIAR